MVRTVPTVMGRTTGNLTVKSSMHRVLSSWILLCTCLLSSAYEGEWRVYPSYTEAAQVVCGGSYIYAIMTGTGQIDVVKTWQPATSGNLVRYDADDGSVRTYDSLGELNSQHVRSMSYNDMSHRLLLLYDDHNIDLLDEDDEVVNLSFLKNSSLADKEVNTISQCGTEAYLCMDWGFIDLDTREAVIRETYRLNTKVNCVSLVDGIYYIGTDTGLYGVAKAEVRETGRWELLKSGVIMDMVLFDGRIYVACDYNVYYIDLKSQSKEVLPAWLQMVRFRKNGNTLLMDNTAGSFALFAKGDATPTIFSYPNTWKSFDVADSRSVVVASGMDGVIRYGYDPEQKTFVGGQESLFTINSPTRDTFYRLNYAGNRLLVAGGVNTQAAVYFPETMMIKERGYATDGSDDRWIRFDEDGAKAAYPQLSHRNAVSLVQDPADDRHFYGAVYRNGLHEYRMDDEGNVKFVKLYNHDNSPLEIIPLARDFADSYDYCTCTALQYDSKGNLWLANQQTDTIVRLVRPDGKWLGLYYQELAGATNVYQYLFSSCGINFVVADFIDNTGKGPKGFFGFDTRDALNTPDSHYRRLRSTITNQNGTTYNPTRFFCMAEDHDREIWCGTSDGLFVITNPAGWFDDDFTFHQIIRNRDDGSGYADYLLNGVTVTAIAVDGANRKWVGTSSDGVYLFNDNGQETICHFTAEDTPLLSNYIQDIAVEPYSGRVMFATDKGLCSFDEGVTEPEEELDEDKVKAYPNPVEPGSTVPVTITGLTDGAEVKILSSAGQAVWGKRSVGGKVVWNCCNMKGNRVSSGVYHVVACDKNGKNTVVTRIIVMK